MKRTLLLVAVVLATALSARHAAQAQPLADFRITIELRPAARSWRARRAAPGRR